MAKIEIEIDSKDKTAAGINSAKVNIRELGEKVTSLGLKMTGAFTLPMAALGRLILKNEEVQKSLEPIKTAFSGLSNDLAMSFIPVIKDLTPSIISLADSLAKVVGWFSGLTVEQKKTVLSVLGVIAALGPLVMIIGQVIAFVGTLQVVWGSLSTLLAPLASTILPVLGGALAAVTLPVWALIGAIGLLVGAIVIFGERAWNTIVTMTKLWPALFQLIAIKIDEMWQKFLSVDWVALGRQIIQRIAQGIANSANILVSAIQSATSGTSGTFTGSSKHFTARANGGSVSAGHSYMVGENGPEMFVPSGSGSIIPNSKMGGVTLVYSPTISLASQSEAENVLLPMLRKAMRAA